MHFDFILLIILFVYIRNKLQTKILLPQWNRVFMGGIALCIALLIIEGFYHESVKVTSWIAHLFNFTLIYLCFSKKELEKIRNVAISIIPMVLINFIEHIVELANQVFYLQNEGYFETADTFAVIWLGIILFIDNRQRKTQEKDRKIAAEKEKEFQHTSKLKAELEIQVVERTAEILKQKEEIQKTLDELKSTQTQLIQSEKMASLGELTAGIAHEIQNPLNFVNNFSDLSNELIDEMNIELDKGKFEEAKSIAIDIKQNLEKINHHGKRADAIVKGMLQHSRSGSGQKEPTDINSLCDEYLRLCYHGLRAKDKSFNATMKTDFDQSIGKININPQDMGRVILNLLTNAFYAVDEKKNASTSSLQSAGQAPGQPYEPTVSFNTKKVGNKFEIRVSDNGNGIQQKVLDKIFQPFFTTKPTGKGTGLGLSLSYDIVTKGHGGFLKVETAQNEGSTFIIQLPL